MAMGWMRQSNCSSGRTRSARSIERAGMVPRLTEEMEQSIRRYMYLQKLVVINWIHNGHALIGHCRNLRK